MIDDIIIKSHLDSKSKMFMDCDKFIIFDKENSLNCINKYWWQLRQLRNIIKVENKFKKRGITVYYYSYEQICKMNFSNFKFDGKNKPEFNKIYFKFDKCESNFKNFYTYNNFLRISENYKYDFFVFLFSKFGLKEMNWDTSFNNEETINRDLNVNIGLYDENTAFQYTNNNQNTNNLNMQGKKKIGNTGSIDFFNCCYARSYWYSYCAHNIDEAVKKILDSTDKYCYHYYQKNDSLKNKLENRLGDILVDDYVVTSNSENINLIKHVMRISNKYAKIGFEFNSNNISTESFTKKYRIQYFERDELELTTIEQIKSNKNLQTEIDMEILDQRYSDLNKRNEHNMEKELENLQNQLNKLRTSNE